MDDDDNMMKTSLLTSGYGKNEVLHKVDFTAGKGLTAIIGANGSGKSTLLKSICGLCDKYSGKITWKDRDITNVPTYKIAKLGISYMAQRENVFPELTIYENLIIGSGERKPDLTHIYEMFPTLKDHEKQLAKNLSGGQRQLLALAMVVTQKPEVMLFDEPTANLSPKNAKLILKKIIEVQKELDNCVILVEQNVKSALDVCENCYMFTTGTVRYSGNSQQLLNDPDLSDKYLGVK